MKSLTKKALSLAMAMAMAGSFAVSAAGVAITDTDADTAGIQVAVPEDTNVSVGITLEAGLASDSQVTMIAYKVADAEGNAINGGEPGESNIVYINQFAATELSTGFDGTANAAVTQGFTMRDGEDFVVDGKIVPGTYKIMFGWTGVAVGEAAEATLVVTEETATITYKPGDINNNGVSDGIDMNLLLQHILTTGLIEEGTPEFAAADINGNGVADGIDMNLLLQHILTTGLLY